MMTSIEIVSVRRMIHLILIRHYNKQQRNNDTPMY